MLVAEGVQNAPPKTCHLGDFELKATEKREKQEELSVLQSWTSAGEVAPCPLDQRGQR